MFFCAKENLELILKISEMNKCNVILEQLKLNQDFLLKYAIVDDKNFSAFFQGFKESCLVSYDMEKFNKPKTLSTKRELIYMNSGEIMLFSNKVDEKMIKIIDLINLEFVDFIGQCSNEKRSYYFKDKSFRNIGINKYKVILLLYFFENFTLLIQNIFYFKVIA